MHRRTSSYTVLSLACIVSLLLSTLPVQTAGAQAAIPQPAPAQASGLSTSLPVEETQPAALSPPDNRVPQPKMLAPGALLDLPAISISPHTEGIQEGWELLPPRSHVPPMAVADPRPPLPEPADLRPAAAVRAQPPADPSTSSGQAPSTLPTVAGQRPSPASPRFPEPPSPQIDLDTPPVMGEGFPVEPAEDSEAHRSPARPVPAAVSVSHAEALSDPSSSFSVRGSPSVIFLPLVARNYDPAVIPPRGGAYVSPDERVTVAFPPGAVSEGVLLHYEAQEATLPEGFAASTAFFALGAETAAGGAPVETFGSPLEIQVQYEDAGLPTWLEQRLHLHYYDETADRWERLPTVVDTESNVATAWTTHFTDFGLLAADAAANPCEQKVQIARTTDPGESYSNVTAFDYYTGTEISLTCAGADGDVELEASGPGGSESDSWTFNGGVDEDVTELFFAPLPGEPAEHDVTIDIKNDPLPGTGSSAFYLEMKDVTPPEIRGVNIWQDGEGGAYVEAVVVDNCAVASVILIYSSSSGGGGVVGMGNVGGDSYGAAVHLPRVGVNSYAIVAVDAAGNPAFWGTSMLATYSGAFGWNVFKDGCPPGTCGSEGEPVNTASGNFTYHTEDLRLPGTGETDVVIERGYNSQSVPPQGDYEVVGMETGPFGPGWTFPFSFRLEFVDNLLLEGVKVHYPDGRTARFEDNDDTTFTSLSPGIYDTLTFTGAGYVLEQKNLTEYHFDTAGRLTGVVDPNGNTQSLTYDAGDQLMRVESSAGRWIELDYNTGGLITDITAPEGVHLVYTYTEGLLTSFTGARGKTWGYEYDDAGRLTAIVTPRGHPSLRLEYDEWGRVEKQIEGATAERTFAYDDPTHTRTIVDANSHRTTHVYDEDYRLIQVTDGRDYSEEYDYDEQDRRVYFEDKEGREWHYEYDDRGNLVHEEGPLDWERA